MTARRLRWAGLLRLAAVVGIVAGFGGVLTGLTPHAAAGEPTATPFVRVRIDQVTPDVVTTTSDAVVTVSGMVTNIGDRPVRDVMVRLEHAGAVTSSVGLAHLPGRRHRPIPAGRGLPHDGARTAARAGGQLHPVGAGAFVGQAVVGHRPARDLPRAGQRQRNPRLRRARPARQRAVPATRDRRAARQTRRRGRRRRARHLQTRVADHAVAAGRPAPAVPGRARRHHPGPTGRRRLGHIAGHRRPAGHPAGRRRGRHQPRRRPRRRGRPRAVPGRRPGPTRHRQRDDRRLRRVQLPRRPRPTTGHPHASRYRSGRRHHLAGPTAGAGPPDLRDAAALRRSRSGRPATRPRPRVERGRHQQRRRRRRPDSRHRVHPRGHRAARRAVDQ